MRSIFILVFMFLNGCAKAPSDKLSINQLKKFEEQSAAENGGQANKYVKEDIETRQKVINSPNGKVRTLNARKDLTTGEGYVSRGYIPKYSSDPLKFIKKK